MPDIKEIRKMLDYKNPAEHKIRMVKIMLDDVIEKEALEQPVQEPLTRAQQVIRANNTAQPAQEPVVWGNPKYNYAVHHKVKSAWQGLTDDEIEVIDADCWIYPADGSEIFNHYKFARAIETKLKEKNT